MLNCMFNEIALRLLHSMTIVNFLWHGKSQSFRRIAYVIASIKRVLFRGELKVSFSGVPCITDFPRKDSPSLQEQTEISAAQSVRPYRLWTADVRSRDPCRSALDSPWILVVSWCVPGPGALCRSSCTCPATCHWGPPWHLDCPVCHRCYRIVFKQLIKTPSLVSMCRSFLRT